MEINTLKNKTVLLVNTGSLKKKFILQKIKKLGVKVLCLNKEKNWANDYVDQWILADTFNHQESLTAIKNFLKNHPSIKIDGALTFWEDDVLLTSKVCETLGLVGIPFEIAKRARNKYLFREFCSSQGIAAPKHHMVQSKKDIVKAIKKLSFPLVIKPVYGSSSAFVVKVENANELMATYQYIRQNISITTESALHDGMVLILEEYIDGDEVDMDILLQNGKIKFFSISDNSKTREPFFVETGQNIPSNLPVENQAMLINMAEEALEKLGVQYGCIHFEAKMTSRGAVPIEINLRMGGDEVYSFVKKAWGVDLIENAIKIATNQYVKIEKPKSPLKYLAGQYFLADYSGVLAELNIDSALHQEKSLEEINFFKEVGDPVLVPPEGYDFLGWITVSGDNPLDAEDNLKKAIKLVNYNIVRFDQESAVGKTSRKDRFSPAVYNKNILMRVAKIEKVKKVLLKNQRSLRVALVGNVYDTVENLDKNVPVRIIWESLVKCGYDVVFFNTDDMPKVLDRIKKIDPDIIFNATEELLVGLDTTRAQITAALESLHIPITGSESMNLAICQNKILVKKILNFHNIPTPNWDYVYKLTDNIKNDLQYPLIIKPALGSNSFGITNDSVVYNHKDRDRQIKKIILQLKTPALIEEYIEGDEYEVSVLGNSDDDFRVLPLARSIFVKKPGVYPIHSYESNNFQELNKKKPHFELPVRKINKKFESLLSEIALDTYTVLHCQDYGRVEIRTDKEDNPYVLEIDNNPSLFPNSNIIKAANLIRLSYSDLLEDIIRMTINRFKNK